MRKICILVGIVCILVSLIGFSPAERRDDAVAAAAPKASGLGLVAAGLQQIGVTTTYDPAYATLKYPNGDVPIERGVCCDVIIRALRASEIDLQKLVHEDMKANFSAYPKLWGLRKTDTNIDHRRVPNLAKYFERAGKKQSVTKDPSDYLPGDFVVCRLSNGLIHIMLVSNQKNADGRPLVIHNIGSGAREEDRLFEFTIEGHYRWYGASSETKGGANPSKRP
jgi:uncharacterized protein YijF (DUF1287 family)